MSLGEEEGAPSYRIYRVRRVENEHIEPVLRSSVQVTFSHFEIENMRTILSYYLGFSLNGGPHQLILVVIDKKNIKSCFSQMLDLTSCDVTPVGPSLLSQTLAKMEGLR